MRASVALAIAGLVFAAASCAGEEPRVGDTHDERLDPKKVPEARALIAKLGSDDFATRDKATDDLIAFGLPVVDYVRNVLADRDETLTKDPEVRMRLSAVITGALLGARDKFREKIRAAISKGLTLPADKKVRKTMTQTRLYFDFMETPLPKCLEAIEEAAKVPIATDPDLGDLGSTPITLRVHDMPAEMILAWVLRLAELDFTYCGQGMAVGRRDRIAPLGAFASTSIANWTLEEKDRERLAALLTGWKVCAPEPGEDEGLCKLVIRDVEVKTEGDSVSVSGFCTAPGKFNAILSNLSEPKAPPGWGRGAWRYEGGEPVRLSLDAGRVMLGSFLTKLGADHNTRLPLEPKAAGKWAQEEVDLNLRFKDLEAGCAAYWIAERAGLKLVEKSDGIALCDPTDSEALRVVSCIFGLSDIPIQDADMDLRMPLAKYLGASSLLAPDGPCRDFVVLGDRLIVNAPLETLWDIQWFLGECRRTGKPPDGPSFDWKRTVLQTLDVREIVGDGVARTFDDACRFICDRTGISVLATRDSLGRLPKDKFSLPVGKMKAKEFVKALAEKVGGTWALDHGVVAIRIANPRDRKP